MVRRPARSAVLAGRRRPLRRANAGAVTHGVDSVLNLRYLSGQLLRISSSLFCAGLFYSAWLAAFLLAYKLENATVQVIFGLLAPAVTAMGFSVGIVIFEHLAKTSKSRFYRIFTWAFIGCAIGAGIVYWFGPMLIVFGMFGAGTASIALKEIVEYPGSKRA